MTKLEAMDILTQLEAAIERVFPAALAEAMGNSRVVSEEVIREAARARLLREQPNLLHQAVVAHAVLGKSPDDDDDEDEDEDDCER